MPGAARPPRVEIIALTDDDALLEQIGQALDGESTIRHADSVDAAREFIRPLRPCVLLLDARGQQDLAATVDVLQSPDGTCVAVVLATANESANVSNSLRGSATFAILPIPVEQGQTMAVLEGAREEALARLTLATHPVAGTAASAATAAPAAPAAPATRAAPATIATPPPALATESLRNNAPETGPATVTKAGSAASAGGFNRRSSRPILAGLAFLVVAAICVAWFTLRTPRPSEHAPAAAASAKRVAEPDVPPPPAPIAAVVPAGSSDELLEKAHIALGARHYTDPDGDNALAYFRAVLAQDPANDEAREGLQRIGALLDERLQSELGQRKFTDAAGTLANLRLIRPGDPGLAQIDARLAEMQISAAIDAGNIERASQLLLQASQLRTLPDPVAARLRNEIGRRQGDTRAQVLAQLVTTRIREGKLLDPATDSAKFHLAQLRNVPSDPRGLADAATAELQEAYLLKIRDAAAQSDREGLDRWLAEARALGVSPTRLADAMRTAPPTPAVQPTIPQSERLAQLVQDRIRDGRLLEPSRDSAVAYLNALRAEDPTASAVTAGTRALSNALLNRGRQSLADRNLDAAQADAAAAGQLGVNTAEVDDLERAIRAARAASAARSLPPVEIKRTRYVPPEYPADALKKGIRGEVRVRITVGGDGKVKSATVVNSNPADVFDRAALDAVRRWRFAPPAVDNPDTEATVMTNIVFRPDETQRP